jgi:hypothetical protein
MLRINIDTVGNFLIKEKRSLSHELSLIDGHLHYYAGIGVRIPAISLIHFKDGISSH